jgi:hypothetical protein
MLASVGRAEKWLEPNGIHSNVTKDPKEETLDEIRKASSTRWKVPSQSISCKEIRRLPTLRPANAPLPWNDERSSKLALKEDFERLVAHPHVVF